MSHYAQTFSTARAKENLAKIAAALIERGSVTPAVLAEMTGLTRNTVGGYLHHLEKIGAAHCSTPTVRMQGGSMPSLWSDGKAPVSADRTVDDMPRTVTTAQQWVPNHQRDPLVSFLFGAPAAA